MKTKNRKEINNKQKEADVSCHHVDEKIRLFNDSFDVNFLESLNCMEYFSGHGAMTELYKYNGLRCETNDIKDSKIDSYQLIHKDIYNKKKFDVIDLDPYGLPFRMFPNVFELFNEKGFLFVTSVKYHVPILNWRRKMLFQSCFNKDKPTFDDYSGFIIKSGLMHYYKVKELGRINLGKNTIRYAFSVEYLKKPEEKKNDQTVLF